MSGPLQGARCCGTVAVHCCTSFSQSIICPAGSEVAMHTERTAQRGAVGKDAAAPLSLRTLST
eukprot:11188640-Lingulodinium_polyedra.AAC.1